MCDGEDNMDLEDTRLLSQYLLGNEDDTSPLDEKAWGDLPNHARPADRLDAVMRLLPERLVHSLACDFAEQVLYLLPRDDSRPFDAMLAKRAWLERTVADDELDAAAAPMDELHDKLQMDYYNDDMEQYAAAPPRAASAVILAASRNVDGARAAASCASEAVNLNRMDGYGVNEWETQWQITRLLKCLGVNVQMPIRTESPENENELRAKQALQNLGASLVLDEDGRVTSARMIGYQVQGAPHLASLPKLRFLHMSGFHMIDSYLDYVKEHTGLEALTLGDVSDAALAFLRRLVNLRSLNVGLTKITDVGLVHLQGLSSLEALNLSSTEITDRGLHYLRELANLTDLDLSSTQITDRGMVCLQELANLTNLDLSFTGVTAGSAEAMSRTWPECMVMASGEIWLGGECISQSPD